MGACFSRRRHASRSVSEEEIPAHIPAQLAVGSLARQHKPGSPHKPRTSSPQTRDALLRALRQLEPTEAEVEAAAAAEAGADGADGGQCALRNRTHAGRLPMLPEARSSHEAPSESGDAF